jgi:hypothetical protein
MSADTSRVNGLAESMAYTSIGTSIMAWLNDFSGAFVAISAIIGIVLGLYNIWIKWKDRHDAKKRIQEIENHLNLKKK